MSYALSFKGSAQKEFRDLPARARAQIAGKLDALAREPRRIKAEALKGQFSGLFRIRVGQYRVVYQLDDAQRQIVVTSVRHRGRAYR